MGGTYRRARKIPLIKESRTIPVYGTGDDEDRYYKCWNCGFICDSQRDELGTSNSSAGIGHTIGYDHAQPDPQADNVAKQVCLGGEIGHYHVALEVEADSDPKQAYHNYKSDISRGCPFCGTTNWRGDY